MTAVGATDVAADRADRADRADGADGADRLRAIRAPGLPGVGTGMRTALSELWFHWTAALAGNVAWTVVVLGLVVLAGAWPLGALVLAPLVALPLAGLYRMAGLLIRGEPASAADGWAAWRTHGGRALQLGVVAIAALAVLGADLVVGLVAMGGLVGFALATAAAWGLLFGWAWLLHAWPLLLDPRADGTRRGVREAAVLGARTALLFPGRALRLTLVSTVVLLVSAVLFAVLATFAVAWVALLGAAVVLPAADRIDAGAAAAAPTPGQEG
ncbi:MAG: hypothetical protein U0869_15320 [Chloroflexota bacterium]